MWLQHFQIYECYHKNNQSDLEAYMRLHYEYIGQAKYESRE